MICRSSQSADAHVGFAGALPHMHANFDMIGIVESDPFAAPVLQSSDDRSTTPNVECDEPPEIPLDLVARPSGFEPLTYGSGGRRSIQLRCCSLR